MHAKRYAIVTGAASGLGRALAVELGRRGWHVAMADVNDAGAGETLELVRQAGGDGQTEHLDVTSPRPGQRSAKSCKAAWPRLDLLVNNAGVGCAGNVGELPLDDWRWIININLYGAIYGCHAMIDWMKQNPRGAHIVNIASMAAIMSAPGMAPYNVTKAGMLSLSETLCGELKPYNIGVTGVCPAFFPTNILKNGRFHKPDQRRVANTLDEPRPHFGRPRGQADRAGRRPQAALRLRAAGGRAFLAAETADAPLAVAIRGTQLSSRRPSTAARPRRSAVLTLKAPDIPRAGWHRSTPICRRS